MGKYAIEEEIDSWVILKMKRQHDKLLTKTVNKKLYFKNKKTKIYFIK